MRTGGKVIAFAVFPATVFMAVFDAEARGRSASMRVLTQLNVIARYVERMLAATIAR
jgi:hypothetical protein